MTETNTDISSADLASTDPAAGGCRCCASTEPTATTATAPASEEATGMNTAAYTVTGMTCGHCVAAVSAEIGKLAGVTVVGVDLATGAVSVTSAAPLAEADVAAAVEEAGYQLTAAGAGTGTGRTE